MDATQLYPIALAVTGAVAVVQTARLVFTARLRRLRITRRARRAAAGERDAERLLTRAGYRVLDRQVQAELDYAIDGDPLTVSVRADLLVARGGETFVAEVKTGDLAPRLRTPATRRQLLEYAHAFDVDGVLLVEPESGRVRRVDVPRRAERRAPPPGRALVALFAGATLGAAATAYLLLRA